MIYTLYILKSNKSGRYYVGSTSNIIHRLAEHNGGRVKSTRAYIPWSVAYTKTFHSLSEARRRELQAKSWKSRDAIEKLLASSSNG